MGSVQHTVRRRFTVHWGLEVTSVKVRSAPKTMQQRSVANATEVTRNDKTISGKPLLNDGMR
jgi:hypothetical protein